MTIVERVQKMMMTIVERVQKKTS